MEDLFRLTNPLPDPQKKEEESSALESSQPEESSSTQIQEDSFQDSDSSEDYQNDEPSDWTTSVEHAFQTTAIGALVGVVIVMGLSILLLRKTRK